MHTRAFRGLSINCRLQNGLATNQDHSSFRGLQVRTQSWCTVYSYAANYKSMSCKSLLHCLTDVTVCTFGFRMKTLICTCMQPVSTLRVLRNLVTLYFCRWTTSTSWNGRPFQFTWGQAELCSTSLLLFLAWCLPTILTTRSTSTCSSEWTC